ncbi:MAG: hypothetical protein Q9169_001063 [Polycauliona sp. 2 TL-2023]
MVSLRSSQRKQQTRLSFNPLPTSSPAASGLPEQIQSRAAAVRYGNIASPSKKRRLRSSSGQAKLDFDVGSKVLPTPEPSSQVEADLHNDESRSLRSTSSTEDDEPISPRKSGRIRRGFTGTHNVTSPNTIKSPINQVKKKTKEGSPLQKRRPITPHPTIELGTSDKSDASNTLNPSERAHEHHQFSPHAMTGSSITVISDEESDPIPVGAKKRGLQKPQDIPHTPQSNRSCHASTSSSSQFKQVSVPITVRTPTRSSRRPKPSNHQDAQPLTKQGQSSAQSRHRVEVESEDSSDSLMNELRDSSKKPGRKLFIAHQDAEDISDQEVKIFKRGRRKPFATVVSSIEESDPEEDESRSSKSQIKIGDKHKRLTRAKDPAAEKSARQKQLDLLRKRRAGESINHNPDGEDRESDQQDSDLDVKPDEPFELEEDDDSGTERVRLAIPPNQDEYEEDFVDDEDDAIGAPAVLADIPLEFTRHAHKKYIDHFKDVVEWMIHNKLNQAFARHDPVYRIAVRKLDDVVQGYAGSKFMSSAWKAGFIEALKTYPDCTRADVPTMYDQKCEACGRSGHPAKHQLTFSGRPYDRESLEEKDEDDSDEPEAPVKAFFLGRTCNANAETAHSLYHWRHQLNQFVLIFLRSEGHLAPDQIIKMNDWNTMKKYKYANGVVDGMEANGQMKDLYKEFKQNIDVAREAKNDANVFYGRRG